MKLISRVIHKDLIRRMTESFFDQIVCERFELTNDCIWLFLWCFSKLKCSVVLVHWIRSRTIWLSEIECKNHFHFFIRSFASDLNWWTIDLDLVQFIKISLTLDWANHTIITIRSIRSQTIYLNERKNHFHLSIRIRPFANDFIWWTIEFELVQVGKYCTFLYECIVQ